MYLVDDIADFDVVRRERRAVVVYEAEVCEEGGCPERSEGGCVGCAEEVDCGVGGEAREEGLNARAAERERVDGVEKDVYFRGGRVGGQVGEEGVEHFFGLAY